MQSHFAQLRNMPLIAVGRVALGPARSGITKCYWQVCAGAKNWPLQSRIILLA